MNSVEIADAVADLFSGPYDRAEFPYAFLEAFGIKGTTVKRLRSGNNNASDIENGILLRSNIHLATCELGTAGETLKALRESLQTVKGKAKFILATDGEELRAEDLRTGEPYAMPYAEFPNHFGAFLELGGISTVKEIKDNPIDIRATGRLNKLYVELLNANPEWQEESRRPDLNHFFARLIFCFFAEDTGIFHGEGLFTKTVDRMTESDGSNVHEVLEMLFRAMNTSLEARKTVNLPLWAEPFPYVNGGLFSGSAETPRFTKIARAYLRSAGELNWTEINPDIFGSMIQAVADDEERGALGMHYTSVPNILKVLNPLFLDDLRAQLEAAGDSPIKLLNLRKRMAHIRVFDPACGSGNFLVIAYKQMREIEAEINRRRGEPNEASKIPPTNFRGIEIRDFAAEVARLALIIAEYQADVLYRGQQPALMDFLPLAKENWIWRGNALRLDWTTVCPPTGMSKESDGGLGIRTLGDDLFSTPLEQTEIAFSNEGGETFICGNPPYKGTSRASDQQKDDLKIAIGEKIDDWGLLDYVCGWFFKAFEYSCRTKTAFAFVATNSIAQGQHVSSFWKPLFDSGLKIRFAVKSFKWSNLAANDAGITVVCVGAGLEVDQAIIFDGETKQVAKNINAYLLAADNYWVEPQRRPVSDLSTMVKGNYYGLSEHLIFDRSVKQSLIGAGLDERFVRRFYGSTEVINAKPRNCLWLTDEPDEQILSVGDIRQRISTGRQVRAKSKDALANGMYTRPYQFREMRSAREHFLAIPVASSENREYLPVDLLDKQSVISNMCFALYDSELLNMALIASRLHWVWIGTVCVRLRTDFRYSNTLGWNTFPVPTLTQGEKDELTRCAEEILLARERHFPATIADLYDPEAMPEDLRRAHDRTDETLERIYIGRRFKNDTERLEKLFEMYTAIVEKAKREEGTGKKPRAKKTKGAEDGGLL